MRIFEDRTKIEVRGVLPMGQPRVETEVIRYRPEDPERSGVAPTVLYTRTQLYTTEDTPFWISEAIHEAARRDGIALDREAVLIRVREADAIRQAIRRHDELVAWARTALADLGTQEREAQADVDAAV